MLKAFLLVAFVIGAVQAGCTMYDNAAGAVVAAQTERLARI